MSSTMELLVLLGAVYLLECAQWVAPQAVGFSALLPGRWRLRRPFRAGGRFRRGALLGSPLPPLHSALVTEPLSIIVGRSGIITASDPPRMIGWDKVRQARAVDHQVEVAGVVVAELATRRMAVNLARLVENISKAAPKARARVIGRWLDERFLPSKVRHRLRQVRRHTLWLRASGSLLLLCIFGGIPAIVWSQLATWWLPVLGTALFAWLSAALSFHDALRRTPDLQRELWPDKRHRFLVAASPLSAMRAADLIAREAVGDLDPLAVGAALLSRAQFGEQARLALVDLRWAARHDRFQSEAAREDARWQREQLAARIEQLVIERDLLVADLLAPPVKEERVQSWCPRCRAQYLHGDVCTTVECLQMPLVPFDSP